jgi:DNA-binding GntR family transcriptional regulator
MLVNQFATGGIGTHVRVSLTPIITTSVRALLQMRERLLRGEFHPGERIREIPFAARLYVSRTPMRLVLGRLEEEGLVAARSAALTRTTAITSSRAQPP